MTKFEDLILKASNNPVIMHELTEILDVHFTELEIEHPKLYWETINEIYVLVNGMNFDEETSKYAVSCFKNEDGTEGEHWTLVDTNTAAQSIGIMFTPKCNQYDWYFTMNMMYSDYYPLFGDNTSIYINLSKAFMMDKDGGEQKPFRYWRMIKGY